MAVYPSPYFTIVSTEGRENIFGHISSLGAGHTVGSRVSVIGRKPSGGHPLRQAVHLAALFLHHIWAAERIVFEVRRKPQPYPFHLITHQLVSDQTPTWAFLFKISTS